MKKLVFAIIIAAPLALVAFNLARPEPVPSSFYKTVENRRGVTRTPKERQLWLKQSREILGLWRTRKSKNTLFRLMQLASSPDANIRERSIRLIGRMENRQALPLLRKKLAEAKRTSDNPASYQAVLNGNGAVPLHVVQLAFGRTEGAEKSLQAKIHTLLKRCRIRDEGQKWRAVQWSDVIEFSRRDATVLAVGQKPPSNWQPVRFGSPAFRILYEVVDVLRQEKAQGKNTSNLEKQLVLSDAFKMHLANGAFSPQDQLNELFSYSFNLKTLRVVEPWLIDSVLALPPQQITKATNENLEHVLKNPRSYPLLWKKWVGRDCAPGLDPVWKLAAIAGDEKTKQLLTKFSRQYPSPLLAGEASRARLQLEKQEAVVLFPLA